MAYMVYSIDVPNSKPIRDQHRKAHLAYLDQQVERLIASGGLLDDTGETYIGSCILIDVDTEEEARSFVAEDPFTKAGLAKEVVITLWRGFYLDGKPTRR